MGESCFRNFVESKPAILPNEFNLSTSLLSSLRFLPPTLEPSYDGGAMPLPVAEAVVEDLTRAHRELLRLVDSLSESDWERPVPCDEWTVNDLIAHMIGDMSPSGPCLILAGILTPEFIADTPKGFDVRARNASMVESRRHFTREDLRQLLFDITGSLYTS